MYHPHRNEQTDFNMLNGNLVTAGTGLPTAKALAYLLISPAIQLFLPIPKELRRFSLKESDKLETSSNTTSSNEAKVSEHEIAEVTNENAGSIKASSMVQHLRHTKN